jgi:hypothetical protein
MNRVGCMKLDVFGRYESSTHAATRPARLEPVRFRVSSVPIVRMKEGV